MENLVQIGNNKIIEETRRFGEAILNSLSEYPDLVGMMYYITRTTGEERESVSPNSKLYIDTGSAGSSVGLHVTRGIDAETGEKTKFFEMKDRSVRCALWLRKQGVGENDVVGVSTPVQMNDYVAYLGTLYVNAILNPWPYDATEAIVQHFLDTCRPKVIFACEESVERLAEIVQNRGVPCKLVVFEKHLGYPTLENILAESTGDEVDNFKCTLPMEPSRKVSAIYLSSGTTGMPKAILLTYYCLARRYSEEYGMHVGMNCLWYAPLQLNLCRSFISSAILLRCTRIVHRHFDAERTSKIIQNHEVNFIYWTPYFLMSCYQANVFARYNFKKVDTIAMAGAKPNRRLLEECQKLLPHTFIKNSYGITEAGGLIAQQTKNRNNIESVGFLCSGVELKVIDPETNCPVGPNQEGELHIKTDTVMVGYLNNPEMTKQTLDENGWLHTGDLGFYDDDGEITVTSRIKEIIRTKSLLLSCSEFEEPLMQHPGVSECAVVAVEHPVDIERPFAFVVKARHAKVTAEELIEFSANKSERYRLTGGLVFVNELPYTTSGKKCLRKLQEIAKTYIKQ